MRVPGIVKSVVLEPTSIRVTALISIVYAAVFIASVVVHETVPAPPPKSQQRGLDLDQAWLDLQEVSTLASPQFLCSFPPDHTRPTSIQLASQ